MSKKFLTWLFVIGTLLRLAFIWVPPFWYDENFTLLATRLPMWRMLAATAGDVHPPLYYLVMWPIAQLVDILHAPIWILRLPSVLFSVLSLVVFALILQRLDLNPRVKVAAMVLMTVMPFQLYYAQEARMYTLLEFLTLFAFLAMLQRRWAVFGLALGLLLYTQNYGIFNAAVLGVIALIRYVKNRNTIKKIVSVMKTPLMEASILNKNKQELKKILIAGALACLAFLPWLLILRGQMDNISDNYWMRMTTAGLPLLILFRVVFMPQGIAPLQIPLMLVCFAWLTISAIMLIRDRQWKLWYIAALAFVPLIIASVASWLWQPILHYRPLIGSTPFLYILLAYPVTALFLEVPRLDAVQRFTLRGYITQLYCRKIRINAALFAAIFLVPALLISILGIYLYATDNKTNDASADMLAYLRENWQPGDIILDMSDETWINMTAATSEFPHYRMAECNFMQGELSDATRRALGVAYLTPGLPYRRAWVPLTITPLDNGSSDCVAKELGLDLEKPDRLFIQSENMISGLWIVQGEYASR